MQQDQGRPSHGRGLERRPKGKDGESGADKREPGTCSCKSTCGEVLDALRNTGLQAWLLWVTGDTGGLQLRHPVKPGSQSPTACSSDPTYGEKRLS
ncbi:hypothetical protein STEG23_003048 [Scotinomys teguina]